LATSASSTGPILRCEKLSKCFGALKAVWDVDLSVSAGERRSIIGPNGAGKTTLFNVISGELPSTSGRIFLCDKEITRFPSFKRLQCGLARTFQVTNLFREMTVLENVLLGLVGCRPTKLMVWKPLSSYKGLYERADELLEQFGLSNLRSEKLKNLSHGDQRLLEVVLGLCSNPLVLALDEPSSGLSSAETEKLVGILNTLDPALTLLVIEHDMRVAFHATKTMTVMHEGRIIADGTVEETRNNPRVRECYLGTGESE
jgi:branched-chain amino acid transport system ATP-binding protein